MTRDNLSLVIPYGAEYIWIVFFRQKARSFLKPRFPGLFFGYKVLVMRSLTKTTELRLINLRWLSVLAMLAVALFSRNIVGSFELAPRLLALGSIVGCMNLVLLIIATRTRGTAEGPPVSSAFVQLCIDLLSWASYIYLSGGATNPLITVFLPLIAIGAMVLDRLHALILGSMAVLAYTYLWFAYQPLAIQDAQLATRLHILGMWLVFVVSDVVVIWFIVQMTKAIRERDVALNEAREQAIRNDWVVSMGSLAAGAAHELSTPLGTLNVLVDDLLDDPAVSASLRPDLEMMRRQIDACKLTLTQLAQRAGHPRGAQINRVTASAWLRRLVDSWLALNPSANISINIAPELERHHVSFDASVERAITSLLDNAQQVGASHIVIAGKATNETMEISIDDDGPGIPAHMLESFAAGQSMTSSKGMGVGLLLARTAIERCGGVLHLSSSQPDGTQVQLLLPLRTEQERVFG